MLSELISALYQCALFVFYFFYFLFKGKPEWQKVAEHRCAANAANICCLHSPNPSSPTGTAATSSSPKATPAAPQPAAFSFKRFPEGFVAQRPDNSCTGRCKRGFAKIYETVGKLVAWLWHGLRAVFTTLWDAILWVFSCIVWLLKTVFFVSSSTEPSAFVQQSFPVDEHRDEDQPPSGFVQRSFPADLSEPSGFVQRSFHTEEGKFTATPIISTTFSSDSGDQFQRQDVNFPSYHETVVETSLERRSSGTTEARNEVAEFYTVKHSLKFDQRPVDERSQSSYAPPAPPAPTEVIRIPTDDATDLPSETISKSPSDRIPKGGVPVLPLEILEEASARIKEREQRSAESKEAFPKEKEATEGAGAADWTVTSSRRITDESGQEERRWTATGGSAREETNVDHPWKLTNRGAVAHSAQREVVEHEPHFTSFRVSKPVETQQGDVSGGFMMGRCVFSPVREAEELRSSINRKASLISNEGQNGTTTRSLHADFDGGGGGTSAGGGGQHSYETGFYSSRLSTPYTPYEVSFPSSRMNTPFDVSSRPQSRNFRETYSPSRSRSHSRLSSFLTQQYNTTADHHFFGGDEQRTNFLRQRSRTVEPRENVVRTISRQWPPKSNATGVEVVKDNWNLIPSEVKLYRRVMEKSVTDKWTTRDESGSVLDEWAEKSWQGHSDGLRRRNDGTGETWHRAVDVDPYGRTSFVDNKRHYARDYVIESETRNM